MQPAIQKTLRTCVSADGTFLVGIHRPAFEVKLLRDNKYIESLGTLPDGTMVKNEVNFPDKDVEELKADFIYEIPNAFSFRGTTYINSVWADSKAGKPEQIYIPTPQDCSLSKMLNSWLCEEKLCKEPLYKEQKISSPSLREFLTNFPSPLKIALAQSTTDPNDLLALIPLCCTILFDENEKPAGLLFKRGKNGEPIPDIHDHTLFELIGNNPYLPDVYKRVMVLKPGIQGKSEITGEWLQNNLDFSTNLDSHSNNKNGLTNDDTKSHECNKGKSHVFEYLRRNSYIPWGHFAANTADDTVRYSVSSLTTADMAGMRHLYYQRTYLRLAEQLDISLQETGKTLSGNELEALRCAISKTLNNNSISKELQFNGSLWGWNFGFGYAQSGYRLHASHQQIHQQYAMIPKEISNVNEGVKQTISKAENQVINEKDNQSFSCYACGDMIADFIESYKNITGKQFFDNYIKAIRSNKRTDLGINRRIDDKISLPSSLIVYEDNNIILFVPKAQTSQWELQLMAVRPCGNILEADTKMRTSLDIGILMALQILEKMGSLMVTSVEFSKRFDSPDMDQRILYSFMPRLPESPGAFSEAQLRWINGHYPEDFAESCRVELSGVFLNDIICIGLQSMDGKDSGYGAKESMKLVQKMDKERSKITT